jgi:hypothetical protein
VHGAQGGEGQGGMEGRGLQQGKRCPADPVDVQGGWGGGAQGGRGGAQGGRGVLRPADNLQLCVGPAVTDRLWWSTVG